MDSAIESMEFYDFRPSITDRLNDDFIIEAYNDDVVTHPSRSLLVFQGQIDVKKQDDTEIDPITGKVALIANGLLHLFDRIEYHLGNTKVDDILRPGITSTIKGLASFSRIDNLNDAGWCLDATKSTVIDTKGNFHVTIPLSTILGIMEDYKGYIYRMPQKLIFTKHASSSAVNSVLCNADNYKLDVNLKNVLWRMPLIKFNVLYDAKIKAEILRGYEYEIKFRHWLYNYKTGISGAREFIWDFPSAYSRAKYVLIGFQTNRDGQAKVDMSKYDYCDLRSLQVQINDAIYYPKERPIWNKDELKYGSLYTMFKDFKLSYYSKNPDEAQPLVDMKTFINDYPIVCIDCSRRPDVIKEALINIKIRFEWKNPLPDNTTIHCVIIADSKAMYCPLHSMAIA
jgi:hypothetical protein